ncbi:MAG: ATP-binding protein [Nitrospinota bacterium]
MYEISDGEVQRKIGFQNPWWEEGRVDKYIRDWTPRAYLELFYNILADKKVNRAVVLMGPRRVGKTVMIYHAIQKLINNGVKPENIIYISIDTPNYFGYSLEKLLALALEKRLKRGAKGLYVFFDEIQYLKDWEIHLKSLVDQYRGIKFVASGSAAAALKLKSRESGAGRFTDFILPPLTFYEYLMFIDKMKLAENPKYIKALNKEFINYLNYGGYPEALFSEDIQRDPGRYIRSDIIDKVLLRDLPGLYGINDIQELNRLFVALARNTANEISLKELSKNSGVKKPTIRRYIQYLEAAFLIKRLPRIDKRAKKFKRAVRFKVHLTNPSMHCALFGPVDENSENIGSLVETAIFSQLLHSPFVNDIYYARWDKGEIDLVLMMGRKLDFCIEVKWSDSTINNPNRLKEFVSFAKTFKVQNNIVTTRTILRSSSIEEVDVYFSPASVECYSHGKISFEVISPDGYLL